MAGFFLVNYKTTKDYNKLSGANNPEVLMKAEEFLESDDSAA